MIKSKQIQKPRLVLVVDDHEINRDALEMILEDHYDLIFAENGEEGLRLMREHAQDLSIVLLDLMMPVMTGFEVLEHVRDDETLRSIPIIVLTSERSAELEALRLGAADFITKPFDVGEIILVRVNRIVELSEGRQLISAAERDPLTGLYSKNFFYEYVERIHQYHPQLHMDALVLNIEQFHSINDVNGRRFGDDILKAIGAEMLKYLSETDGIASRFEADHFYMYSTPQEDYHVLLNRLQEKVTSLSPKVSVYLRMGVSPWSEDVEPIIQFDRARVACNKSRGNYQNPLTLYDEEMRLKEALNQRLLNDLRIAADEGQFLVYYQPKYDIQCEPPRLSSAEALIRWRHPELGMISPGEFVPLFERNGLINVVDSFVWKETARQIVSWKKKYGMTVPVSVNLSRADLFDPTLVDRLIKLIQDNGLEYHDIKLEVTESAYTENAKEMLEVISHLRHLGFEIEMDDFGSGYSSLNMLSDMPVDVLKMDMKFVQNIEVKETDLLLVKLILDIARYLKLKVVAEGVETDGQLSLLRDACCDLVQGFYFSRPLPPDEFEKLIEKELDTERK